MCALIGLTLVSLTLGSYHSGLSDVLRVLAMGPAYHADAARGIAASSRAIAAASGGDPAAAVALVEDLHHVVWHLRVPRTGLALAVGASLAMAGAVAQVWTGNDLADPGVLGISAGAACAIALGLTLGVGAWPGGKVALALLGAAVAAGIVLLASRRSEDPVTLILVGIGVMLSLQALTNVLMLYTSRALNGVRNWAVGSTTGASASDVALAGVGLVCGALCALACARSLDLLAMGTDAAAALGVQPARARAVAAAAVIVLAGTATAAAGMVFFLGFAAPHIARRIVGPVLTRMLPLCAVLGAGLAVTADTVGRFLFHPGELEMSIVLSAIGAPLMIAAVCAPRRRRREV